MFESISQTLAVGLIGSLLLVIGAAWPAEKVDHPIYSKKDWLFATGGILMLVYSLMNYFEGGSIFFVFLQALVNIASILMMLNTPDKVDVPVLSTAALALVIWSLYLFEGVDTIFFILGLLGIALGYAFENGSVRRDMSLTIGSFLIAGFSYMAMDWVFFGLNIAFGMFSAYYLFRRWV